MQPRFSPSSARSRGVFLILVASIIMGIIGGMIGVTIVVRSGAARSSLGLTDNIDGLLQNSPTRTDKIVLEESSAVIDAVKKVSPSVVSITITKDVQDFFGQVLTQKGGGTGFIISSDGLIATNKHVVSDAGATYSVFTSTGKEYSARVVSQDPFNDLAVVKIEASGLPVVEFGDSDKLQVGQYVIAIGNALGEFSNTVTLGVLSARNRKLDVSDTQGTTESLTGLLQTDAAINPGNSGGPLINLRGQVIGVNTAVAQKGIAEGIGFAIPSNAIQTAVESVKRTGKIVRPQIGVRYIEITKEIAEKADLPIDYGALVYAGGGVGELAVIPGSPADKAGIVENDIITNINRERIDSERTLVSLIQKYKPGDQVEVTYLHKGEEKRVKVTLTASE